MVELSR